MISNARRGALLAAAAIVAVVAYLPAAGNPPFKTVDVASEVTNAQGVPAVMAVDSTGSPVFAMVAGSSLEVVRCNDPLCATFERNTVVSNVPAATSLGITLDATDFPVVAWYNSASGNSIKMARCIDVTCADPPTIGTLTAGATPALHILDLVISPGDRLAAAVDYGTPVGAIYARCFNSVCNQAQGGLLTSTPGPNTDFSTTFGVTGFPVVSFNAGGLQAAFCSNDGCTSNNVTLRNIDMGNAATGLHNTVEIHPITGYPVFAYSDGATGDLKIAFCSDVTCLAAPTIQTLATEGTQGRGISLTFEGANPVVVSRTDDAGAQMLRWIRCEDATCTTKQSYTIDGPNALLGTTPPTMAYSALLGYRIGTYDRDSEAVQLLHASPDVAAGLDVDCDGYFDATDVQIIMRALAGLTGNATATAPCTLDVNGDTVVDLLDALYMRQAAAGIIAIR